MHWASLTFLVASVAAREVTPIEPADAVAPGANRDEKLFSVFQIVRFNNDACDAVDGTLGTCYTASECTAKGGQERGPCASSFGVCCVSVVDPCGNSKIALNNSYIVNRGFPGDVSTTGAADCSVAGTGVTGRQAANGLVSTYTIAKAASDIVQFRLDFQTFEISNPMMGNCANDTITISGADPVTMKIFPSNLCGVLTGSHVYISVKDVAEVTVTVTLSSLSTQKWNILVRQFDSTQTEYLAPRGCLQYYREDAGMLETFNYNGGNGELLNDQMYTMCIAQNDLYCDVALTSSSFMLGGSAGMCSDAVVFGTNQLCGSTFGTAGQLNWNYTGSYNVPFMSDGDNMAMDGGFSVGFVLLPC